MRPDLITLKPKFSRQFLVTLGGSVGLIIYLINSAATSLYYKIVLLGALSLLTFWLLYQMLLVKLNKIDLLLHIKLAIIWTDYSLPLRYTIKSIKPLANLAIVISCVHQHHKRRILLFQDSISPAQFKQLMRCARWTQQLTS